MCHRVSSGMPLEHSAPGRANTMFRAGYGIAGVGRYQGKASYELRYHAIHVAHHQQFRMQNP